MSFRMHHRKLYVALEAAEGVAQSIATDNDYIECIEPTFTTTARTFERNPTRKSITPAPLHTVGTGKAVTKPSATVEFSFQIELAGSGTAGTAPRWARVLETCGLKKYAARAVPFTGVLTQSGGPDVIQTFDKLAVGASVFGRALGDTFNEDSHLFYALKTSPSGSDPVDTNVVTASVAPVAILTATGDSVAAVAYVPTSEDELGGGNLSSATVRLYLDDQGDYIEAVGCRSSVEFAFASGDRVLLNVTMTGRMKEYVVGDGTDVLPESDGTEPPPGFVGVSLNVADSTYEGAGGSDEASYTDLIFNTMSVNLGNDVVVRENVSTSEGYDVAYITGRSMQMTFNPDAVTDATTNAQAYFWDQFLSGDLTRMSFTVGTETGNKFIFRFPAAQFTGIADGNRDETMVWDSSCTLTGGDYGSSIQERTLAGASLAATPINNRLGRDNEFVMFML